MTIQSEQLETIAKLARLETPGDQVAKLTRDLGQILDFVEQMQKVDTSAVEPLSNPLEMTQRLRKDEVTESNQREKFQAIAPATENGLYLVPKVID
ncbi:Asp-tRNA(Asn)/Glu-tRNA(Gln) amidotransferase subunit GatC [Hahella sp. KA22]|uniref:Asp-tRNA(Asn)/Glu-tRNA(Gln) amidotransferase subunit GatC n=1 Tax=unclassified Hahella TaxID=2624107 RepID=UPI000FDF062B|nr:Asp-tRNA(Asn)/Glu-tRNA(Gln) amidotransferase subunit GatC [Hahella sp. KA22]AZZ90841.1 Asp-tRNA(Asn)/Glu-tRNA(Gln) amidotransferase subunit GatC [Hahella sp. KA22]QAY54211.1 Asp-tRNA(Asn)/Glu-tRNA(Gln) amidotransferase subunit GatC [Hahella sp. KA22]